MRSTLSLQPSASLTPRTALFFSASVPPGFVPTFIPVTRHLRQACGDTRSQLIMLTFTSYRPTRAGKDVVLCGQTFYFLLLPACHLTLFVVLSQLLLFLLDSRVSLNASVNCFKKERELKKNFDLFI